MSGVAAGVLALATVADAAASVRPAAATAASFLAVMVLPSRGCSCPSIRWEEWQDNDPCDTGQDRWCVKPQPVLTKEFSISERAVVRVTGMARGMQNKTLADA